VAPESRTQRLRELEWVMPAKDIPICIVCATEVVGLEFWWFSYHLRNSLKAAEEPIDEVRETTLKLWLIHLGLCCSKLDRNIIN